FRYIDCQIQILKQCPSTRQVREALTKLPATLEDIYFNAIEKLKNSLCFKEGHYLLLWLLYSFEPLNMSQVAVILSIDLDARKVEADAEMLHGLEEVIDTTLVTVYNRNIVQLSHASVKEFLLESNRSLQEKKLININAELAHDIIAQMCLIYLLNQSEEKDIWKNSVYMWRIDIDSIETFEQYATQYWGDHSHYINKNSLSYNKSIEIAQIFLEQAANTFINWTKNFEASVEWKWETNNIFAEHDKLHVTAWFGLETSAQRLLTNTDTGMQNDLLDVNTMSKHFGTALQIAAARGHKDTAELLLQQGAEINAQGGHFGTAVQGAAFNGYKNIVEFLVQQGAEINTQGGLYSTALQAGADNGHKDIVEFLVQHGADINAQGGYFGTALQAAADNGHKDIVEFLVQQGADINAQGGYFGTALQAAAVGGHQDIVEYLVQQGAEINAQGGEYGTALQAAAYWGKKDTVEFLVQQGAEINTQGGQYGTALQAAAYWSQKDTVEFLVQQGAEINAQGGKYVSSFLHITQILLIR
ncbi:ankyrin repeat-containing domain protein, partial [Lentinula raphanica]